MLIFMTGTLGILFKNSQLKAMLKMDLPSDMKCDNVFLMNVSVSGRV